MTAKSLRKLALLFCASFPSLLLAQQSTTLAVGDVTIGLKRDPALAATIADISAAADSRDRLGAGSFGTRHAMSDTLSPTRGIGAARRYLFDKLRATARRAAAACGSSTIRRLMEMRGHPDRPEVNIVDVEAWLPGRDTSRVIVMGGHYDSCGCARTDIGPLARFEATQDAPGADDDGSGTSAIVELARVFSKHFPHGLEATVIFVAYSGEEEGLYGSTHLAQRLHAAGYKVISAFTDDIVGNVVADDGTPTRPAFASLAPSRTMGRAESSRGTHGRRARSTIRVQGAAGVPARSNLAAVATTARTSVLAIQVCVLPSGWRTTSASICRRTISLT